MMKKLHEKIVFGLIILLTVLLTSCPNILTDELRINEQDEALKLEITDKIDDIMPESSSEIDKILNSATTEQLKQVNENLSELEILLADSYEAYTERVNAGLESRISSLPIYDAKTSSRDTEENRIEIESVIREVFGENIDRFLDLGLGFSREFLSSLGLSAGGAAGVGLAAGYESIGGRGETIDFRNFTRFTYDTNSLAVDSNIVFGAAAGISFEVSGIISNSLVWRYKQKQLYEKRTFAGGGITGGLSGNFFVGVGISASATYAQEIASSWDVDESDILEEPGGDPIGTKAITVGVKATASTGAEAGITGTIGVTGVYGNNRPVANSIHSYIEKDNPNRADYFIAGLEMAKDVLWCHDLPPTGSLMEIVGAGTAIFYGTFYDPANFDDDAFIINEVVYNPNGAASGTVPRDFNLYEPNDSVPILGNTGNLDKADASFLGWGLTADGSGTIYSVGDSINMGSSALTLYAIWDEQIETDTTPPAEVTNLIANPGDGQVVLSWTDPTDTDFDHVEITWSPNGTTTQVIDSGIQTHTASALANNTQFTFTVKTVDVTGNVSIGSIISSTPSSTPADISFTKHTITENFEGAFSVYATDIDGDGDIDLLGTARSADDITWWENDGNENFTEHTIDGNFDYACSVYATDINGDGDVDVLGTAWDDDDIVWWENDGNENFTKHLISFFNGAYSVYAIDVDGDGDIDVLGAADYAKDITWWENDGNENFTEHTIKGEFDSARSVYATDIDGDGDIDVLGAALYADDITWWENDGNENFTEHTIEGDFNGATSVYAADIDGDGYIDVLGAALSADDVTWWENDGNENFTEHTIEGDFDYACDVYATDIDGDGDIDVLGAANGSDDITWWENNGSEDFTEHTLDSDFDGVRGVYAIDVDGDGDIDILGAAEYADAITWWENNLY